jgi:ATP-binding cassette, subfamily B, multidrug efflux pump
VIDNVSTNLDERQHQSGLTRLWPFVRPYEGKLLVSLALVAGATGVEVAVPYLLGRIVDSVTLGAAGLPALQGLCLAYLGVVLAKGIFSTLLADIVQRVGQGALHDLRSALFGRILGFPVSVFDQNPVGRLLSRVINDIKSLSEVFTASMSVLAVDVVLVMGTVAAMLWLHPKLALVALATLPIVGLSVRFFGRRLAVAYRRSRTRLSEINAFLGENIGALATIQRLSAENNRMSRFTDIVESHNEAQLRSVGLYAVAMPVTNALYGISLGALLLVGGKWAIEGMVTVGTVVAFAAYLKNLFNPVEDLIQKYNLYLSARVSAERVNGILEEATESEMEKNPVSLGALRDYSIEFDRVSFRYPKKETAALEGVSFTVPSGTSLAVVGATGSGKSTLLRLLLRFYDPGSGEIRFAGRSLTEWNRFQLRRQIGLIPQDLYLFEGTLRDNLSVGREGFSDAFLEEQSRKVELWEMVRGRGGLDCPISEGGTNFSLGERQLIAFARTFAFNPPVLVLDEATASLDRNLERKVLAATREILRGRTSIVIAHRLSTVQSCDQGVVLELGRVAEQGTLDELKGLGGIYSRLHLLQG